MKRLLTLGVIVLVGAASISVAAYQAPAGSTAKTLDIVKVKDNLYVITSSSPMPRELFSGGNVAVFITDAGVTLVDTKLAGWGPALLEKVKSVTSKPVTTIINTHTHGDHTGNNDAFGKVEVVAHENTRANMAKMDAFKGKEQFLPGKTYRDKLTIGSGKDQIDLYHFGAAHTNGDTVIVYPALRVLHMGDMFAWKDGPLCDRNNGGSCVAYPKTLANVMAGLKNIDVVIPGHSPMMTMKDVQGYQEFMTALVAAAQAAMGAGKTVDDAFASFDIAKYPGYKNERVKASMQVVFDELKK
ncbi:MAG: MBL fold metallo-hydrolase [Acidobacteria bacterium]|nr:MBL fold metallo-hydrolase [Acidobacteriota bacterium]